MMSVEEKTKKATSDLSSLSRVEHKIVLTEANNLERVLTLLLPRLLSRVGSNHSNQQDSSNTSQQLQSVYQKIHVKLVSTLSHIMKRVRSDPNCKLPCDSILKLLLIEEEESTKHEISTKDTDSTTFTSSDKKIKYQTTIDPFTLNLALAFLTLGVPRCEIKQVQVLLPGMLVVLSNHAGISSLKSNSRKLQASQVAHLLLRILERVVLDELEPMNNTSSASHLPVASPTAVDDVRKVIVVQPLVSQVLYDLILDSLLYQPMNSRDIPPLGLSQAGHKRLTMGASTTHSDWATEMAGTSRLREFKLSLLTLIAPTRRWSIFMENKETGISQTIALLVAATGDKHVDVADRATSYLKAYWDSLRGGDKKEEKKDSELGAFSDRSKAIAIVLTLQSLVLGDTSAESALKKLKYQPQFLSLGLPREDICVDQQQASLSLRRRMASDKASAVILSFCAKVLDENPFMLLDVSDAIAVGDLSTLCATKILVSYTSGLSAARGTSYIAASKLLNALCSRLTVLPSLVNNESIHQLYKRNLSSVCTLLKHVTSHCPSLSRANYPTNEGSVTVRDACYGIVCSLSRCTDFRDTGLLFGESSQSVETASLLFGCAANEVEILRPRAVAALDALLGGYVDVYCRTDEQQSQVIKDTMEIAQTNPWAEESLVDKKIQISKTDDNQMFINALLTLLWGAVQSHKAKASRVSATRWASELLKLIDKPNAYHLLCYATGDSDTTVSAIARASLGLNKDFGVAYFSVSTDLIMPDFGEITKILFTKTDNRLATSRPRYFDFSSTGKAAALRFGLKCMLGDLYGGEDQAVQTYFMALCETLQQFVGVEGGNMLSQGRLSHDLFDECAISLSGCVSNSQNARCMIVKNKTLITIDDLKFLSINGGSSKARRYLAESIGHLFDDVRIWSNTPSAPSLEDWIKSCNLLETLEKCAKKIAESEETVFRTGKAHGAAFLAAEGIRSIRRMLALNNKIELSGEVKQCLVKGGIILATFGRGTRHDDEVIGNFFANSINIALSHNSVDAPLLNNELYSGVSEALTNLDVALRKFLNGSNVDPIRAVTMIRAVGKTLAASTSAAGYVSDTIKIGQARLQCVGALFKAVGSEAFRKDPEVAVIAGEALAIYADAYNPKNATWSRVVSRRPSTFDESVMNELPPHEQVLYALLDRDIKASSPHTRTAAAPALMAIVAHATRAINHNPPSIERALALELVKKLPDIQTAFLSILSDPRCKQLSRESCCLGLAACHSLANAILKTNDHNPNDGVSLKDSLNDHLLRAFGQTTKKGDSAMIESRQQNEERLRQEGREDNDEQGPSSVTEVFDGGGTEVGGTAGLGEAALGAYREMTAAAVSLGRSDVLYALLILSMSHPFWKTPDSIFKYNATSILGENSLVGSGSRIRDALRPHLGNLIPRLLRAKHDPNKQTREQMETLWSSLTGGGAKAREAISKHLLSTIDTLINDASNKLWRARVGACGALAEVIVGRSWINLGGGDAVLEDDVVMIKENSDKTKAAIRLLRLWKVTMRAVDDIRLSVRESGETLARSLRGLTIRLCDPVAALTSSDSILASSGELQYAEEVARAASSTSLRWLVKIGLNQQCPEMVGICISCLVGIVEVVQPEMLELVLPEIIGSLLMAMSGLEPAALNHLQVRAAGRSSSESYDRLEQARLQAMQTGPINKALIKCLDMAPRVKISTRQAIVSQLDSSLRGGAGFATRAATADSVASLCNSCPSTFNKFSGTSSTNPSVRLLRALYYASERERGIAAKDKMSHALGSLASQSPGQSVRSLVLKACSRYSNATGNNEDPTIRRSAAAAVRSIVVRAPNQLLDGGPNDIWGKKVLPVAFLGQKDEEKKIASIWKDTWEEAGTSLDTKREHSFGVLVEEKILPNLVKACTQALDDVSWARRIAGASSILELCEKNILTPIAREISKPNSAVSLDSMERARRRAKAANIALTSCIGLITKPRIWNGKSEVVKTTVKLVGKWIVFDKSSLIFGWSDESSPCPWQPISFELNNNLDLFLEDRFFEAMPSTEDFEEETKCKAAASLFDKEDLPQNENDSDTNTKIDFVEGDKIMNEVTSNEGTIEQEGLGSTVSFQGLCKLLLNLALPPLGLKDDFTIHNEALPLRATALKGLTDLLKLLQLSAVNNPKELELLKEIYESIAYRLIAVFDMENLLIESKDKLNDLPPLIVACSIKCLGASVWKGIGNSSRNIENTLVITRILHSSLKKQGAWTVKEAAVLCSSSLVDMAHLDALRDHKLLNIFMECSKIALKNLKFWRVRLAGLMLLRSLVKRAGIGNPNVGAMHGTNVVNSQDMDQRLMLEAILPFKEDISRQARASLADSQPEVKALASEVCGIISWWS